MYHMIEVDHETVLHLEDDSASRAFVGWLIFNGYTVCWIRSAEVTENWPPRDESNMDRVEELLRKHKESLL